ncbi:Pyrroline-5-carboxylate reductase [Paramagnetospirillum magnetotacticum MS-1]|uniref:Pyrroline-5-carboxylate reductase n=1 Tax=Paramagnetospirillum magnetotacticum MS-1 TaxID=272627 RepID=A0A0C2YQG6_PARME|nr:pyrroline-5-carboxylate reductase [Paramagnetospirillum magnetotacticum]KIL97358.1 Pyrroline-5-carboxylate reductase [Paramagnetospirillum magnetotacticum MS-1]
MTKILLVGCGKMGSAMLAGWLERGTSPGDVVVVEPSCPDLGSVRVVASHAAIPEGFVPHVVIFAVKPQVMADVVPPYARFGTSLFLSIAAGKTIAFFRSLLGPDAVIVRAMPNTPAAVRRGITVCCAEASVPAQARDLCGSLLEAVGEVGWVDDEALMDVVTAVSGSGPAYIFLLAEAMEAAGLAQGLPPALAERLARATVAGAGELLRLSSETTQQLRQNVTSPGGTTAAALAVLMAEKNGIPGLMSEAVAAATRRGRELAG